MDELLKTLRGCAEKKFNYDLARKYLIALFRQAEEAYSRGQPPTVLASVKEAADALFAPVLLTVAMFRTLRQCFNLDWEIEWQGINVADKASGAGGDITIRYGDQVALAIEVTERPIDRSRVVSTFNTKISPHGIEDYLFFSTYSSPGSDARAVAVQYFAQGHEVGFLQVKPWLTNLLGTIGTRCRSLFTSEFLHLLDSPEVPAILKVAWNDLVKKLLS